MKIAIIGAGACGLMLAIKLNKIGILPDIYNSGKVARKILASGNGKCNISNSNPTLDDYLGSKLAYEIVKNNKDDLFKTFKELEIYTKETTEGRLYPYSESSQSVVDIFLKNIKSNIIDLEVTSIDLKNGKYYLNNSFGPYDYVVIATGSKASFRSNLYLKKPYSNLSLKLVEERPSLVGFKTKESLKSISGARSKALASLYSNNKLVYQEAGEVIFKDDGISGICIMNLSSYYQRINNNDCYLVLDLAEGINVSNFQSILTPKLYNYILKEHIDPHHFRLSIKGTYDFEFAQVVKGGISLDEMKNTLELKKYDHIYCGGEVLDFDALCGGYNLMLAFCSALQIFKELNNEVSNK